MIETLFAVGVSFHVHELTKNKELINMLLISYDKLLKIETLSNVLVKEMESCIDVYVSPGIQHGSRLHFTFNNVRFHNDASDGKNEFQGTSQVVFQKNTIPFLNFIINQIEIWNSLKPIEYPIKIEILG